MAKGSICSQVEASMKGNGKVARFMAKGGIMGVGFKGSARSADENISEVRGVGPPWSTVMFTGQKHKDTLCQITCYLVIDSRIS